MQSIKPFGLRNTGVICYYNSFMQSLMSCNNFIDLIMANKEKSQESLVGKVLYEIFSNKKYDNTVSVTSLIALLKDIRKKSRNFSFGSSQESASEAFILMLDALDSFKSLGDNDIFSYLFRIQYRSFTKCPVCEKEVYRAVDHALTYEMFGIKWSDPSIDFFKLIGRKAETIEGYECLSCKKKVNAERLTFITKMPEVFVLQFNVYRKKELNPFPIEFSAPGLDGQLQYKCVAQIEHSGGLNGGHYWARIRRDKVYIANDESISPGTIEPTPNTYLVFYERIKK